MAALTKRVLSTLTTAITGFRSNLRSKRFRVVSEERNFRFGPRQKWNDSQKRLRS